MEGFMVFMGILLIIGLLAAYILAAKEFNSIANQKGYPGGKYGWWCFLFPAAGYLMVIALPDRGTKAVAPAKPEFENETLPEL